LGKVTGCHVIAKGDAVLASTVAPGIIQNGLLINHSFMGVGAFAFYATMVPQRHASKPMVVFEIDDVFVTRKAAWLPNSPHFAYMQIRGQPLTYAQITVLGFRNLSGFHHYTGRIGVV
jgi:hypothetical protein